MFVFGTDRLLATDPGPVLAIGSGDRFWAGSRHWFFYGSGTSSRTVTEPVPRRFWNQFLGVWVV